MSALRSATRTPYEIVVHLAASHRDMSDAQLLAEFKTAIAKNDALLAHIVSGWFFRTLASVRAASTRHSAVRTSARQVETSRAIESARTIVNSIARSALESLRLSDGTIFGDVPWHELKARSRHNLWEAKLCAETFGFKIVSNENQLVREVLSSADFDAIIKRLPSRPS